MRFTPPPEVGQSGGALLDEHGRLVGMVTGVERAAGIGYAVPVSVLREVLPVIAPGLEAARASAPRRPPAAASCLSLTVLGRFDPLKKLVVG